ncbi:MAG TPA: vWA domain-containing protein [Pyrinomonadaceae bacterium]|nr:vWA domain-containing protein [Pyrinomonadaceae bacterium]
MKHKLLKLIPLLLIITWCETEIRAQADVVLAVDMSGTMETNDPQHLRYYGADQFLSMFSYYGTNRNRAGVIKFGNSANELLPFNYVTRDQVGEYQSLFAELKTEEWTELGRGLELSRGMFGEEKGRHKSIILISDGLIEGDPGARHLNRDQARVQAEAELWGVIVPELQKKAIRVYTIGLFSSDTRGKGLMQRLARETGGSFEQVVDPRQFYTIYKAMLDDIEAPAGVATIKGENKRFPLTPADHGVIITGRGNFSVKAPNGIVYPNQDSQSLSGVDHRFVKYPDGGSILFLGQPLTNEQRLSPNWTGEWVVNLEGEGEATFLSSVRFARADDSVHRPGFFKNEYVPINYRLDVVQDMDENTKSFLEECRAEYTMVRTDQNTGWARSGTLKRENRVFRGNELADQPGAFLLEVQMFCRDVRYRKVNERINIFDAELLKLSVIHGSPHGLVEDDDLETDTPIRIAGNLNLAEINRTFPEFKGIKDQTLELKLQYESGPSQTFAASTGADGRLITSERELRDSGSLIIEGLLKGVLVAKKPDLEGMIYFPVTVKTSKTVKVERTWKALLWSILEKTRWWMVDVVFPFASAGGFVFAFFRRKQAQDVSAMSLEDSKGLSRPFEDVELPLKERIRRAFVLRGGPHVTIGGPASGADIALTSGGAKLFAEIGKDIFNKFYIQPLGETLVCLNSKTNPVDQDVRTTLQPNDEILIDGIEAITFRRTFEE